MIAPVLDRLLSRRPLSSDDVRAVFDVLVAESSSDAERAAILVAQAARRSSANELSLFVGEMQRRAVRFPVPRGHRPIDLCGSGGARTPSYNVSTVSAFVVAATGVPVIKHGNRSARGPSGSSDLLEALGLPVTQSLEFGRTTYRQLRLAFLHAPLYHPATRAVAAARKAVGIPTLFNQLGPLSNPAPIRFQLVGVGDRDAAERAAHVLAQLGRRRAAAVTSREGCDEISPQQVTDAYVWDGRRVTHQRIRPHDLLRTEDREGNWGPLPPHEAAEEARRILAGGGGARRGSVLLTAGTALWVAGAARGIAAGVARARDALDSGAGEQMLERMTEIAERTRSVGSG